MPTPLPLPLPPAALKHIVAAVLIAYGYIGHSTRGTRKLIKPAMLSVQLQLATLQHERHFG